MRRALKILAWILGSLVGLVAVAIVGVLVLGNVGPGRPLVAELIGRATGGSVTAQGMSGRFPDRLHFAHVQLNDQKGAYVRIDNLTLDWSPLALLHGEVLVDRMDAAHVVAEREPVSTAQTTPAKKTKTSSSSLRIIVRHLHFARLDVAPAIAGHPAALTVDGNLDYTSLQHVATQMAIRSLGSPGTYHLTATIDAAHIAASLAAEEPPHGLIGGIAGLPDLGALSLHATARGPRNATAVTLALTAGPLNAAVHGTVDLRHRTADLDVTANAPAMVPRPDLSWQAVTLDAHVHGPFTAPNAAGKLVIDTLAAGGATLKRLVADIAGNRGHVALKAELDGVGLPGPKPDLLSASPLLMTANVQLDKKTRPVAFAVSHPLISVKGHAALAPEMTATAQVTLPDLAPFAAIGGANIRGNTTLTAHLAMHGQDTQATIDGMLGITGGLAPVPALVGDRAHLSVAATMHGQDITLSHATLDGATLHAALNGTDTNGTLDLSWQVALSDLKTIATSLSGTLDAHGTIAGPPTSLGVTAELAGDIGAPGIPRGKVQASLKASGLPGKPSGSITAGGTLLGAPLTLAATIARDADGTLHAAIQRAAWKSASATGQFTRKPAEKLPLGTLDLRMTRLSDLRPFIGQPIDGSLTASVDLQSKALRLQLAGRNLSASGKNLARVALDATVRDPLTSPVLTGTLTTDGISANGIGGSAKLTASGPENALSLRLSATLHNLMGSDATIASTATVDATARAVTLASLRADWHGQAIRLLAPARITAAGGMAVDHLRIGIDTATLNVAGRVSPTLALTASLNNVTPGLVKPFMPNLQAAGVVQAEAHLSGALAAPQGTIRLTARGLRLLTGPGRTLPAANLTATAALAGRTARIDAHLDAGSRLHLTLSGTAPLAMSGALALHAGGSLDLALLDPVLMAGGRRVRGRMALNASITGTAQAPRIAGTAQWANGEIQDFVQGVHITAISASLAADGDTLRIARFTGRAGAGTISLSGSVGMLVSGMPVDIALKMQDAQLLASDRLTATLDAALSVKGQVTGQLAAAGNITIRHAEIRVPDHMPASVAVLHVRRAGQKPPPPSAPPLTVALDITVSAPRQIFLRGHGLFAVLAGRIHVGGTTAHPQIGGGFFMRQGNFSIAGTTLTFDRGEITFTSASAIDPELDFEATSTTGSITATLDITGTASNPKIKLSSVPDLPQDEVLAHLLFGRSTSQLSPFQVAEIASALASFGGVNVGINDPLESVRKGLGLDQLTVGSGANGNGAAVQGGRYVAPGVFLGAKQGTGDTGTQATLQIDITRRLKLETDVGSGVGGNSVGLSYQFQY